MATEIGDKTWETFLDQHNSIVALLDTHASLLVEMRKLCGDKSATRSLILGRLNITEKSIATFKQSTESLQEVTKREEQVIMEDSKAPETEAPTIPIRPTKKPKSQKSVNAVPDPSGFFTIDPNPTPIEQLYKEKSGKDKTKENPKRKIEADRPLRAEQGTAEEPERKRPKKNHERNVKTPPTAEDEQVEDMQEADGDDDDFVKAVEARAKAREEKKMAKANKKRKRQSEESTEGANITKNKKRKENHETKSETFATPAVAQEEQKQNDKRPFAQADLEGNEESRKNGGKRKKQRKGKKSKA
ncbi:hypothetical protein CLCR_06122 [Cladophialophora carrionii]|uniref:Uncharacterized protein n=1 Tax=Cladophialophora carrionii TaxID=86049 RepID=A0A1C1C897_9EURO|nr:hypothetical protein CLCR_06122 [Cladophialophora carrionii]